MQVPASGQPAAAVIAGEPTKGVCLYRLWDSGFAAVSAPGPNRDHPEDWIAWHFTHGKNLQSILESSSLKCNTSGTQHVSVADESIKNDRLNIPVDLPPPYPASVVGDHVPFYLAPRSPKLYRLAKQGTNQAWLVYFGVRLGDLPDDLNWCISNGNARSGRTEFTRGLNGLGEFVDFDTLCMRDWPDPEDWDRPRRRQAELLVYREVPLGLVSHVVCKTEAVMKRVRLLLADVGAMMQYRIEPRNYFPEIP